MSYFIAGLAGGLAAGAWGMYALMGLGIKKMVSDGSIKVAP